MTDLEKVREEYLRLAKTHKNNRKMWLAKYCRTFLDPRYLNSVPFEELRDQFLLLWRQFPHENDIWLEYYLKTLEWIEFREKVEEISYTS